MAHPLWYGPAQFLSILVEAQLSATMCSERLFSAANNGAIGESPTLASYNTALIHCERGEVWIATPN